MTVVVTKRAGEKIEEIQDQIEARFGTVIKEKFYEDFKATLQLIGQYPEGFAVWSEKRKLRRIKVYKKTVLLYRVGKMQVTVSYAFDGREDYSHFL